jgi:hypothetical protein
MNQKKREYPTYFLQPDFSERLDSFHEEFIELARRYFGPETSRIESYVEKCKNDRERDGFTWVTFSTEFYFAELAGIAVMNRSMWDDFCRANHTIIFIPDCLSLMGDRCKRKGEKFLEECDQCVPNCVVNGSLRLQRSDRAVQDRKREIRIGRLYWHRLHSYAGGRHAFEYAFQHSGVRRTAAILRMQTLG